MSVNRVRYFLPTLKNLVANKVKVFVISRCFEDLDTNLRLQAEQSVSVFEESGIQPLLCIGNHHRTLAIIDRKILWEGSLIYFHKQTVEK